MKILYVEDDARDADITVRRLHKSAPTFAVETVSTIEAALDRLARIDSDPLDLVLTDVHVHDGDGLSLLKHIREHALPLAVVVITGMGDEETAVAALKARADDYIVKRKDYLDRLPATLESALSHYRADAARRARPLNVLFAENDLQAVEETSRHLKLHADHVRLNVVSSEAEALFALQQHNGNTPFDVLLLAFHLPDLNSLDILRELRLTYKLDVPVVLTCDPADEESARQGLKLGAASCVVKRPGYLYQLPWELEDAHSRAELLRREAALQTSEGRLRLAQQAARVGTWEWHVATGESIWSEMIWDLLGLTPDNGPITVESFVEALHPDDRKRSWRKVKEVLASGDEYDDEFRIVRPDGKVLWLSSKGRLFRAADGSPEKMTGVNIDITRRKVAEETLRRTEEKDRAILRAIPDLMFLQTRDGVYLDYHSMNPSDLPIQPDLFLGKNMKEILPPDLAENLLRVFERASDVGEPQSLEYELTINDKLRWYEARIVSSGENILSVVRDITSRKFVEEALKRNEAQLTGIIESAMDAIITADEDHKVLLFNSAAERIFGCTIADAVGQPLNNFVPEWTRLVHSEQFGAAAERNLTESPVSMLTESIGLRRSGAQFPLEASRSQIEIGGQKLHTVILRDITERLVAQQALRESEERFRNMAETAPVMIWISDQLKQCTYVNRQWLEFTGRSLEQTLGNAWSEGVHPDDLERTLAVYGEAFDRGEAFRIEFRMFGADGKYHWTLAGGAARFSPTGEFLGYVGTALDITDRRESEEALRNAHEALMAAHQEVSRLKNQLEAENIYLQQELQLDQTFGEIIGQSDAIKYVLFKVSQVAPTDATVLIAGETGTGKELVARAIHGASLRKDRVLIKVNCAALAAGLIESELFGHEKGAFTGANARKLGRFELADGGTIFLDEIGELPLELQVKLLRVIQEGEFERLGGNHTIKVDVRIIAATNRHLKQEVSKGAFREDLWYRLNVFPITVPPLRERKDDIPQMVEHFVNKLGRKFGKKITEVSPRTMQLLQSHSWQGNVRELVNVIERATIHTQGQVLQLSDPLEDRAPSHQNLEDMEREHIIKTLEATGWRIEGQYGAAKVLDVKPSTLRTRMNKLGIQRRRATVG